MKILFLSFYYSPDLCAGSFRSDALVKALEEQSQFEIEVITTLPNRYATFSADAEEYENDGGTSIHRIALPSHKSGMFDQIRSFYTYYKSALRIAETREYDFVYATSSRLFTAFLGARIAVKKRIPLYLDIRDIFLDTIKDVLPRKVAVVVKPFLSLIEKYTFNKAQRINLVSRGFKSYFESRFPNKEYRWFTNGIDAEFLVKKPLNLSTSSSGLTKVLYAGNLGEGQGLHTIIPLLANQTREMCEFLILGDGGRKQQLLDSLDEQGVDNVTLIPPVPRSELIKLYQDADVLFLHLNDYPAFLKVLPSKIFEYAALGKPILAGVSGFASEFLKNEVDNVGVFHPGNHDEAMSALEKLELIHTSRDNFIQKYSRVNIMKKMAADLVEFHASRSIS